MNARASQGIPVEDVENLLESLFSEDLGERRKARRRLRSIRKPEVPALIELLDHSQRELRL